jgi:hypothetical protein
VIFVPRESSPNENSWRFVKAHEIVHSSAPWHHIQRTHLTDDDSTLSPKIQDEFEQEANYGAASLIFQGARFQADVRSVRPTVGAIAGLARKYGASMQATLWKFVEESDEELSLGFYYPNDTKAGLQSPSFKLWGDCISSPSFTKRQRDFEWPWFVNRDHVFAELAASSDKDEFTELRLDYGASKRKFQVQAWWNNYVISVLVRRKPRLANLFS